MVYAKCATLLVNPAYLYIHVKHSKSRNKKNILNFHIIFFYFIFFFLLHLVMIKIDWELNTIFNVKKGLINIFKMIKLFVDLILIYHIMIYLKNLKYNNLWFKLYLAQKTHFMQLLLNKQIYIESNFNLIMIKAI
jgi:hypothetical protein